MNLTKKTPLNVFLLVLCFIYPFYAFVEEPKAKTKTICVNMIVKNESKVITRCLGSLKSIIDYWVILDTGSTDGTQGIIKEFMKDVPGELHEEPFVNFEYSRNKALDFAKGKADYVLIIDADEVLSIAKDFKKTDLDKDFYHLMTEYGGTEYTRVQLINNALNWRWVGVLHEALDCPDAKTSALLPGLRNIVNTDGARSQDPNKFQKDVAVLEEALKKDPTNTRYTFYLAQSHRDARNHPEAIAIYNKRAEMGGWDQEVYWSMYQAALLQKVSGRPPEEFIPSLYKAYHYRCTRVEPLYHLANYYRGEGNFALAYLIAQVGCSVPHSSDILFVEKWMYDWGLPLEFSIAAYWIGKYDECQKMSLKILENPKIPKAVRECVERNLKFTNGKLVELYQSQDKAMKKQAKAEKEKEEKSLAETEKKEAETENPEKEEAKKAA